MEKQQAAEQICRICVKLWQRGFVAANDGNVSVRLSDGTFLLTPTGVSKADVTPELLVWLDRDGRVLQSGGPGPSSEWKLHQRCYALRPEVNGVVHAHPPAATAFASAGLALDGQFLTEILMTLGEVPLAPFALPGSEEVPDSVTPLVPTHDAVLLANHGAVTLGKDVESAYQRMESVEHFAKISLYVRQLGVPAAIGETDRQRLRALLKK